MSVGDNRETERVHRLSTRSSGSSRDSDASVIGSDAVGTGRFLPVAVLVPEQADNNLFDVSVFDAGVPKQRETDLEPECAFQILFL